jgi:hypothetical protein
MFCPVEIPRPSPDKKQAATLVVLNPAQSRCLVAKVRHHGRDLAFRYAKRRRIPHPCELGEEGALRDDCCPAQWGISF